MNDPRLPEPVAGAARRAVSILPPAEVEALLAARHRDPFAVLGQLAARDGKLWVRALLPGAAEVVVVDAPDGKPVVALAEVDPRGLFEACVPRRRRRFEYRLRVRWSDGTSGDYADAYAFGPQLAEDDLYRLAEGAHPAPYMVLGAHPVSVDGIEGVRFAVWAPNARRVSVVGDFNLWDGRRHAMRLRHLGGVWEIFVPHVQPGARYKYEICTADGGLLPLKADPYAFATELRPATASIVARLPAPRPLPPGRAAANARQAPVSIYEVHLGSWRRGPGGRFLDWDELAASLPDYVADLGFTHVELLPVAEHPFDGSWGYQTLGLHAPSARFGAPEGLARFIAACHARNVGVLLDWVPGHFPSDAHGLAHFDGTALYEYADPREGFHRDWNTLIYNFARNEVRNFLVGNALYWLERWGADGLRVDAVASMLYRDYSRPAGEWVPNIHGGRENIEAIDLLRRMNEQVGARAPGAITVAEESTAFPGVSHPTYAGGLGFHYKWNMGWMHDTLDYMRRDPVHRKWHHHQITFGLAYAFTENFVLPLSHDEVVHGKGSLIAKMPGDHWQRFANLRAYFGFMWTHPGKKLLFMGGEFGQWREWNHDAELDWHLLDEPAHAGLRALVRDLNRVYRTRPALHGLDFSPAGFTWIEASNADQSIFAYLRHGEAGELALVVCNFTPVPRHEVRIGVPAAAGETWRELVNTDSAHYGGSDVGNGPGALHSEPVASHGQPRSLVLTLPPLGTLILESA